MKIILLLFFSFVVISTCPAQMSAGTTFVGGSASFYTRTNKSDQNQNNYYNSTNTSYSLNPKAGYFIANNVAVGLEINRFNNKITNKGTSAPDNSISRSMGFGPFIRYYKMMSERAGFFGQLAASYSQGKNKSGDFTSSKSTYVGAGIAPGFVFFATPKIGIETTVGNFGYWYSKSKNYNLNNSDPITNTSNQLEGSLRASNVFLGINFYLNR